VISCLRRAVIRAIVAVLVLTIVVVPLWAVDIPPMLDYPNHLARQYILARLPASEYLQQYYVSHWTASPYLAMDAIIQSLATFIPIATAGKVFLTLTLLLLAVAPIALSWAAFGRVTPIALLGLLFVHNNTVTLGFVNYLFGVGFALCLLALWIHVRDGRLWMRLCAFPVLATLLFFSHLLGLVIYILTAATYELGCHVGMVSGRMPREPLRLDAVQRLNLLSFIMQCIFPLSIFLLFGPSIEMVAENMYGGIDRKVTIFAGIFSNLMPAYSWMLDRPVSLLIPIAILLLLVLRKLEFSRPMLWPLGALLGFFFATPQVLFSGYGADHRLLAPIGLLFMGALRLKPGTWRPTAIATAFVAIAILVVVRVVAVTIEWRKADTDYAEYVRAFDALTDGTKMFWAVGLAGEQKIVGLRPVFHLPSLAVMKRDVYVPYLFHSGHIILDYTPAGASLEKLSGGPVLPNHQSPDWDAIVNKYDYFFLVNEQLFDTSIPKQLVPVFKGNTVSVYGR